MLRALPNLRVVATVSILTAGAVVACVPALPGGALDDGSGGAAGSTGVGGAPGAGGGGASSKGIAAAPGPGIGGSPGPAVTGAAGMASGGSGGSPFLLVQDAGNPVNIAADSQYVYWADTRTQSIMRVPVDGGAPVGLAPWTNGEAWVAVDSAGGVYWTASRDIMKLARDAGPPSVLVSDVHNIAQFVVGADAVFWIADDLAPRSRVMKIGRDGGVPTLLASDQSPATAIAVDAMNVYWSSQVSGTVTKVGVSGGEPIQFAGSVNIASNRAGLAVDATSVYWIDGVSNVIKKLGLADGQSEPTIVGPIPATSVAVDAAGVYWTDPRGSVFVASDPSTARRIDSGESPTSHGVTLDAKNVYWIGTDLGSIFRAPK